MVRKRGSELMGSSSGVPFMLIIQALARQRHREAPVRGAIIRVEANRLLECADGLTDPLCSKVSRNIGPALLTKKEPSDVD